MSLRAMGLDIDIDIDGDDLGLVLFIFFGTLIAVMLISNYIIKQKESENEAQPIRRGYARVMEKQEIQTGFSVEYRVVFELAGGQRLQLQTNINTIVVGDSGNLKWQGYRVISFSPENKKSNSTPKSCNNFDEDYYGIDYVASQITQSSGSRQEQKSKELGVKWTCPMCGQENLPWDNICNNCGIKKEI